MNPMAIPVIHPAFRKLEKNGRLLHGLAAAGIGAHGISLLRQPDPNFIYLACLFLISADILILVLAVKHVLTELPGVNLFFRWVEILFFLGIGVTQLLNSASFTGMAYLAAGLVYTYFWYCEKNLKSKEFIAIQHTGISIPDLPESHFIGWSSIRKLDADYREITIQTGNAKTYRFDWKRNIAFDELGQIHEFCRHYLGAC